MKVIRFGELMKHQATKLNEQNTERVIDEKDKAGKLQAMFAIIPPGAPGPKMHYHSQRESLILVFSGEGKEIVDGQEYPLKVNDAIFILPNEKHKIVNTGKTELKYFEIFSIPSDFIVAE